MALFENIAFITVFLSFPWRWKSIPLVPNDSWWGFPEGLRIFIFAIKDIYNYFVFNPPLSRNPTHPSNHILSLLWQMNLLDRSTLELTVHLNNKTSKQTEISQIAFRKTNIPSLAYTLSKITCTSPPSSLSQPPSLVVHSSSSRKNESKRFPSVRRV